MRKIEHYESRRKSRRIRPNKETIIKFISSGYEKPLYGTLVDISKRGLAFTSKVKLYDILSINKEIIIILKKGGVFIASIKRISEDKNTCGCGFIKKLK